MQLQHTAAHCSTSGKPKLPLCWRQMAVAIIAAMVFVVVDQVYDFLGENVVWIVITVGEPHPAGVSHEERHMHACTWCAHTSSRC